MLTEADTCQRYVLPKLYSAGWNDDQINEQKTFTDGRIVVTGDKYIRRKKKRDFNRLKNMRKFSVLNSPIPQTVKELLNMIL